VAEIASKCKLWARTRDPEVRFTEYGLECLDSDNFRNQLPSNWAKLIEGADQEAAAEIFHLLKGTKVLNTHNDNLYIISLATVPAVPTWIS
jgi:hypothetical protein